MSSTRARHPVLAEAYDLAGAGGLAQRSPIGPRESGRIGIQAEVQESTRRAPVIAARDRSRNDEGARDHDPLRLAIGRFEHDLVDDCVDPHSRARHRRSRPRCNSEAERQNTD